MTATWISTRAQRQAVGCNRRHFCPDDGNISYKSGGLEPAVRNNEALGKMMKCSTQRSNEIGDADLAWPSKSRR